MEDQTGLISFQCHIFHIFQQNTDIFHFVRATVTVITA